MELKKEDLVRMRNFQDLEFYAISPNFFKAVEKEANEAIEAIRKEDEAKAIAEELRLQKEAEKERKAKELAEKKRLAAEIEAKRVAAEEALFAIEEKKELEAKKAKLEEELAHLDTAYTKEGE